jgi:hypothetical protein
MDGAAGSAGPSTGAAMAGSGAGALAGSAAAASSGPEMRQTYGEDDTDGYRGWGPTSSNNVRPGWLPGGTAAGEAAGVGVAAAAGGAAGAYYSHHRSNSNGAYDSYQAQFNGENYYYPDDNVNTHNGPPDIPPKSYDRFDPAYASAYGGGSNTDYHGTESGSLGVTNADVQRQPSNASSRYSTVSTDENAGRSYQNSPMQPTSGFPNPGSTGGRPGRSTMGTAGNYEDGGHGGRYDAVNF